VERAPFFSAQPSKPSIGAFLNRGRGLRLHPVDGRLFKAIAHAKLYLPSKRIKIGGELVSLAHLQKSSAVSAGHKHMAQIVCTAAQ